MDATCSPSLLASRFAVQQPDEAVLTLNAQVDARSLECKNDLAGIIVSKRLNLPDEGFLINPDPFRRADSASDPARYTPIADRLT